MKDKRAVTGPVLTKVGRRLVARPTVASAKRPSIDVASLIEEERRHQVRKKRPT
jgi:hypothetical protein